METENIGRKERRNENNTRVEKKRKIKMRGNVVTFLTKFVWIIAIIVIVAWVVLCKINTIFGTGLATKIIVDEETGEATEVIVDDPKKDVINVLFCGTDESGYRTDTILFARYDTVHNKLYMMSVPRDTYIEGLRYGYLRINTIYSGGEHVDALVDEVNDLLNVNIDYYVIINIPTIWSVVDMIGGFEMTFDEDVWRLEKGAVTSTMKNQLMATYGDWEYDMNNQGLWYPFVRKGTHVLNSYQVEMLARNRDYSDGDISRGKMQQKIIKAAIDNFKKTENYVKIPAILAKIFSSLNTNLSIREMMKYVDEIKEFDTSTAVSESMPTLDLGYQVNGNSTTLVDDALAKKMIEQWVYVEPIVEPVITGEME